MGLTTYGITSTDITGVSSYLPTGLSWNISTYSYTNPNVTVTTTTNHSLQVGNRVTLQGLVSNGTTNNLTSSAYNITAVTSNTFTFNYGATTPSSYVSGGIAKLSNTGTVSTSAYLNGRYIFAMGPVYIYSEDGLTWNMAQLPSQGSAITGMAFDGSTYIFAAGTSGLWSSTTLAQGSWTNRSTFGTNFFCHDVKWYGGGINRFVAVGSSDSSASGVGPRIETATSGGATWTNQSIGGTTPGSPFRNSAWDGSNTIVALGESGIAVSTSGAGSWNGLANGTSVSPSMNTTTGAPNIGASSAQLVLWNPTAARWMSFTSASDSFWVNTTTTTPSSYWTRYAHQDLFVGKSYSSTATDGYGNPFSQNIITVADGFLYTFKFGGNEFQVMKWSQTPVVQDTHSEVYPLLSVIRGRGIPSSFKQTAASGASSDNQYSAVYGAGKWVVVQSSNNSRFPSNYIATLFQ